MNDMNPPSTDAELPAQNQSVAIEATAAMEDAAPIGCFQLLRAFMVDSLAKGTRQIFELEGGTVITGVNGRGKTSILQMLLLFYGSNPNKLVSKGKSSFIEYYLPNTSSYLAFEYRVQDGTKRLMIAYANTTGDKVFYRFVRQGYDPKIFVTDDGYFVESKNLKMRLTELNIPHAQHQIDTYADYRAVIQYCVPATLDRKQRDQLKAMCADYAFTRYNKPLSNMDKLALGMFSKTSNFDVFKSITIDSIFESQSAYQVGTQRSAIETWPTQFKAYNEVMEAQDKYLEAEGLKLRCDNGYNNLADLREQLEKLMQALDDKEAALNTLVAEQKASLSEQTAAFNEVHRLDSANISEYKVRIEHLIKELNKLDAEKAQYDSLNIPEKYEQYKNKPNVEADIKSLEARLEAMTESNTPIIAKFERIRAEITERFALFQQAHSGQVIAVRQQAQENLDTQQSKAESEEEERYALHKAQRAELQEALEVLTLKKGSCQQNLENAQVPVEIQEALALCDKTLTDKRKVYEASRTAADEAYRAQDKTKRAAEKLQEQFNRSVEALNKQAQKIDQIIRDNTPAADSLLNFLREQRPQWGQDIGKVLRPDILHRNDLNPDLFSGTGAYGLHLNLDNLDACAESDPQYLEEMIADEQRKQKAMLEAHELLAQQLKVALRNDNEASAALSEANREALQTKSAMQMAESAKEQAEFDFQKAKKNAKQLAQAALEKVIAEIAQAKENLNAFERKYEQEKNLRKAALNSALSQIRADRDTALERLTNELKSKEVKRDVDLHEAQRECDQMLEAQGVDAKSLAALRDKISTLKQALAELEAILPDIRKWVTWEKEIYIQRPEKAAELAQLNETHATLVEKMAEKKAAHDLAVEAINTRLIELDKDIQVINDQRKRGQTLTERLRPFVRPDRYSAVDPTWSIATVADLYGTYSEELVKDEKALERVISGLKRKFERVVNSSVFEAYDLYRQNHDVDKAKDYLPYFEHWFREGHRSVFDMLRSRAKVFIDDITDFHQKLKTFSDKLNRFNRELQEHLSGASNYFTEIKDLTVNIYSAVDELKSWSTIKTMVENKGDWINAPDRLPDIHFMHNLELLLDQWDVKNGITAEFKHLINVRGQVTENGSVRKFHRSEDLDNISSNGLSYLILIILFVAFWSKIRKDSPVKLVWTLDELKIISENNVENLMRLLHDNNIELVCAFPTPDVSTLALFRNAYTVDDNRRLITTRVIDSEENSHV